MTGGVLFGLSSCQFFGDSANDDLEGEPLARVYNRYLYKNELLRYIPKEISEADSLAFVQNYINSWAKDQLMIYKAEYNLTEKQKNFEEQIEAYRNDLLKFKYKQEYIRQTLDTIVQDSSILNNYQGSSNNFILKENIARVRYMVVNNEAPQLKQAIKWFASSKEDSKEKLEDYALKYAYQFTLTDSNWFAISNLQTIIPFEETDQEKIAKNTTVLQFKDATNVYLVQIWDAKLKGEKAPLPYATGVIRNTLINQRKLKLLAKLENNLLDDATGKNEFEIY